MTFSSSFFLFLFTALGANASVIERVPTQNLCQILLSGEEHGTPITIEAIVEVYETILRKDAAGLISVEELTEMLTRSERGFEAFFQIPEEGPSVKDALHEALAALGKIAMEKVDDKPALWRDLSEVLRAVRDGHAREAIRHQRAIQKTVGTRPTFRIYEGHGENWNHAQGMKMSFSSDGMLIATTAYGSKNVLLRETATGKIVHELTSDGFSQVALDPYGRYLVADASNDGIRVWDRQTGEEAFSKERHTNSMATLQFTPNGQYIVSSGGDQAIRVWNPKTAEQIYVHPAPLSVNSPGEVVISPDSKKAVFLDEAHNICILDAPAFIELVPH